MICIMHYHFKKIFWLWITVSLLFLHAVLHSTFLQNSSKRRKKAVRFCFKLKKNNKTLLNLDERHSKDCVQKMQLKSLGALLSFLMFLSLSIGALSNHVTLLHGKPEFNGWHPCNNRDKSYDHFPNIFYNYKMWLTIKNESKLIVNLYE